METTIKLKVELSDALQSYLDDPESYTIINNTYLQGLEDNQLYMDALENTGAFDVLDNMLDVVDEEYKRLKLGEQNDNENTSTIHSIENS